MIIILILNFLVWELLHTDLQSWVQMIWITMSQIKMWYKINVEQFNQVVIIILIYCLAFCTLICLQKMN